MKPPLNAQTCLIACLIVIFFSSASFAQIKFERGYLIDNENVKTECLIRNVDWNYNPKSFDYKMKEDDRPITLKISAVKEFGITGISKFVRAMVKIDRSKDNPNDLDAISTSTNPEWTEEMLFLKEVVDGPATLYSYQESGLLRFFYSINNSPAEQLVYKIYRTSAVNYSYNKAFITQLKENVNYSNVDVDRLEYREKTLEKYFIGYNESKGFVSGRQKIEVKKNRFAVSIFSGAHISSLQTQFLSTDGVVEDLPITKFDTKTNFLVGLEAEYFLPFNKGKWSLPLDIYNRSYSSDGKDAFGTAKVDYSSIEFAIGGRYYCFINDNLNIFFNAFVIGDLKTKGDYNWTATDSSFYPPHASPEVRTTTPIFAFGLGCSYQRLSAEFRYYTYRELFEEAVTYGSSFKSFALMVKYKIFNF